MAISVRLSEAIEKRLANHCQTHHISKSGGDKEHQPSPYELGQAGFGADKVHTGDIARQSKKLLRNKFRNQ